MKFLLDGMSKTIGSLFVIMVETGGAFKIDLIPELSKPEVRNIIH